MPRQIATKCTRFTLARGYVTSRWMINATEGLERTETVFDQAIIHMLCGLETGKQFELNWLS